MQLKQPTLSELREELQYSVENMLIDLFVIDCYLRCPGKNEWDAAVLQSALQRADAFLKQHTDDIYSMGQILMRKIEDERASV